MLEEIGISGVSIRANGLLSVVVNSVSLLFLVGQKQLFCKGGVTKWAAYIYLIIINNLLYIKYFLRFTKDVPINA